MRFRAIVAAATLLFLPLTACGADVDYREGVHYRVLNPRLSVDAPRGKVQVIELFWYGCPHCYDMDPQLTEWIKTQPGYVHVERVPAAFRRVQPDGSTNPWFVHAKAFYALQTLGVGEKLHDAFFRAIHKEHRTLRTEDELATFFAQHGVAEKEFRSAFNSFMVDTRASQAMALSVNSKVEGVPTLIINGKYQALGRSFDETFQIAEYLIALERGAR